MKALDRRVHESFVDLLSAAPIDTADHIRRQAGTDVEGDACMSHRSDRELGSRRSERLMDSSLRRILPFLAIVLVSVTAAGQTTPSYYTVPSIGALRALSIRPQIVEVVDVNAGIFNWSRAPCGAADDIFQVTPTVGPIGCYVRLGTSHPASRSATTNGVLSTNSSCEPSTNDACAPFITPQQDVVGYVDVKSVMGATGNGSTSDAAAFTAAFARTDSPTIYLPPGTYRIPCGTHFTAASAVSLVGSSFAEIKFDANCTFTDDVFRWDAKSGVVLRGFTINMNTPAVPASPHSIVVNYAYNGSVDGFVVEDMSIINASDKFFILGAASASGHSFKGIRFSRNLLTLAAAGSLQNQCIGLTTVNGSGKMSGTQILNNRCERSAIQIDGDGGNVLNNIVTGWKFGNGIFGNFNNPVVSPQSCRNWNVSDNVIYNSPAGVDSNTVSFSGIENSCAESIIANNSLYDLGGAGIVNFSRDTLIAGNNIWNVGFNGPAALGSADQSGILIIESALVGAPFDSDNTTVVGNKVWASDTGWPKYGYYEGYNFVGRATIRSNDFRGSLRATVMNSPLSSLDVEFVSPRSVQPQAWNGLD